MVGYLYKIVSKLLSRRLKHVLPELIHETQIAFVANRQIMDGVLIANEVVAWMKKKKKGGGLIKLDFRKAYDSIKWSFLEES